MLRDIHLLHHPTNLQKNINFHKTNFTFESSDIIRQLDVFSRVSCEDLTHEKWLGQEFLYLSSSSNSQLIFLGQFIHTFFIIIKKTLYNKNTQNSNNILQTLVILQNFLHSSSSIIMLFSNNNRVHQFRSRIQGVHGRIYTNFSQSS